MAKTKHKCYYCGNVIEYEFDEVHVPNNRYYAHSKCQQITEETRKYVHNFQMAIFRKDYKEMINSGCTPTGIERSLKYWYIENKDKDDPSKNPGGLGIIKHIYNDAQKYYDRKKFQQERYKDCGDILKGYDGFEVRKTKKREKFKKPLRTTFFELK